MKTGVKLVMLFSVFLLTCVCGMLVYTWVYYEELRETQILRQMHFLNQRTNPSNE